MPSVFVRPAMMYVWHGASVLIVGTDGVADAHVPMAGFYFDETRFISQLRFTINDEEPWLCESAAVAPDPLSFAYVYDDVVRKQ